MTRQQIEGVIRQRYLQIPKCPKKVGQALVSGGHNGSQCGGQGKFRRNKHANRGGRCNVGNDAAGTAIIARIEDVAHVPQLGFNLFSLIVAHKNRMYLKPEEDGVSLSLLEGRLKLPFDGATYSKLGYRIDDVVHLPAADSTITEIVDACEVASDVMENAPLAVPVIAPGNGTPTEIVMDVNEFHCLYRHANEFILREKAKTLRVELQGKLRPCTGCSMSKGYRKPIASEYKGG